MATVTGRIRNATGQPVANARVILTLKLNAANGGRGLNLNVYWDEQGRFRFHGIVPGSSCQIVV